MMDESNFMQNFTGSGAANLVTGLFFLVFYIVKNKCNHSSCKGNTFCCECEIKDDESESEEGDIERGEGKIEFRKKATIKMQKLQPRFNQGVLALRKKIVSTD